MIRIFFAIVVAILFVSYLPVGCGSSGGGGGTETPVDESPPAAAEVLVSAVRDIGVIRTSPMILKRDCGFTVLYQGRVVWVFGDTLLDTPNEDNKLFLSNSCSSTFDLDAGDGIEGLTPSVDSVGAPGEFFPLTEAEVSQNQRAAEEDCDGSPCTAHWDIWPGAIIVDEDKDWAYVFYRKVMVESGVFKFLHVGHSLAIWKHFTEPVERPVFDIFEDYPTLLFLENGEPGFGSAAVSVDKMVYVYGCELGEDELRKPCHVARVPVADILDKSAWSYYGGNGYWSPDVTASREVFDGNDMMSVSFNGYLNRYVAVYSEHLGAAAMLRTAPSPEGPWSKPLKLFSVDAPENVYGWVYDFLAHPEYAQEDGRIIYVTYTKMIDDRTSELRMVAVELALSL